MFLIKSQHSLLSVIFEGFVLILSIIIEKIVTFSIFSNQKLQKETCKSRVYRCAALLWGMYDLPSPSEDALS